MRDGGLLLGKPGKGQNKVMAALICCGSRSSVFSPKLLFTEDVCATLRVNPPPHHKHARPATGNPRTEK